VRLVLVSLLLMQVLANPRFFTGAQNAFSTRTRIGACFRVEVRFHGVRTRVCVARDRGELHSKFAHSCGQQTALWSHCGIEIDVHRNDSADPL